MGATLLEKELLQYWPQLTVVQQESVLGVIKSMIQPEGERVTIEQYNKEIDEANARIEAGEFYTQEQIEEMAKKLVMKKRQIRWDTQPSVAFREAIAYIRKQSHQNADKVKTENFRMNKRIWQNALKFIRLISTRKATLVIINVLELHHYRISHLVREDEINISRIRHTSQEPREY